MTEPCDLSAVEARRLIGDKQLSPVELLASCRDRTDSINPTLNAMPTTCWDRAEEEAKAAEDAVMRGDDLPVLHGLPMGVKETMVSGGVRTTFGSPIFADNIPESDERLVAVARKAGAIAVGKTNVPEFGLGANSNNPVFGPTGNPFDPSRICGGSSGGSAVALATNMVPLALGSDTGGSLRTPAAYCGVVGYRPTPGLVPMSGRPTGWSALSVQGPMGRDVADTALLLSAIAGYDPVDPLSYPVDPASFLKLPDIDLSSLRVAVSEDLGFAPVDNQIRATFRAAIKDIKSVFGSVTEIDPPLEKSDEVFAILRSLQFIDRFRPHYENKRDLLGPNAIANYEEALEYSFADAAWAQNQQTTSYRRFLTFMQDYDILLAPMAAVPPYPVDQLYPTHINGEELRSYFHWLGLSYGITNVAHPAITIPCGLDPTGTPFGLQICGQRYGDHALLGISAALERYMATIPARARPLPNITGLATAA
ncbi:MAG: amidase family protein [Alphaproteobacteria bacterium]|nr:amidase family protein [Alphaproteobacteria bacterium]